MTLPQPLLVFGPRKSGTTLLHNLLDGGSELIMIPGELKLQLILKRRQNTHQEAARTYLKRGRLDFGHMMTWENDWPSAAPDFAFDGLNAAQTREVFDVENYVAQLRQLLSATSSTRSDTEANTRATIEHDVAAFLSAMKERPQAARYWASKEISSRPEVALAFWRSLFPQSRIVYLVRQPEFIVRSILNDRRRKGIRLSSRTILWHCSEVQHLINYAHQMTFEESAQRPVFIAYEDMTSNTESEIKRVSHELGIAFEPILARPTTLGVAMVVRTSSRATTEVFRQESDWRKGLTPREIRLITLHQKLQTLIFRARREKLVPYETLRQRLREMQTEKSQEALSSDK